MAGQVNGNTGNTAQWQQLHQQQQKFNTALQNQWKQQYGDKQINTTDFENMVKSLDQQEGKPAPTQTQLQRLEQEYGFQNSGTQETLSDAQGIRNSHRHHHSGTGVDSDGGHPNSSGKTGFGSGTQVNTVA